MYRKVSEALFRLRHAEDIEEGRYIFEALVEVVKAEEPRYAKHLSKAVEQYISFLKYPKELRGHIYTTNPVEGLNAALELMRKRNLIKIQS